MTYPTPHPPHAADQRSARNFAFAEGAGDVTGKAGFVRAMFARIVPRYDLVNRLMTMGLDRRWRRETAAMGRPNGSVALDIATGTGDLTFELARQGANQVIGADFCPPMLAAAEGRAARSRDRSKVDFVAGDAIYLPFRNNTFDCIVNGFMLRNVTDLPAAFAEMRRVLKPGGRLACLDLTTPRGTMRSLLGFYIARIVPLLGAVVSGQYFAYKWLGQSLQTHPDADTMVAIMRAAGLGEVGYRLTGFGTVAIHYATKPAASGQDTHPGKIKNDGSRAA